MAGLVEEIQRDSLDPGTSVSTLLRKVRLAAAKLSLPTVEAWVDSELNGYSQDVPSYRILRGTPKAHNPMRGWIAIHVPADFYDQISQGRTHQSVGELEALLGNGKGSLHIPMNPHLIELLNKNQRVQFAEMSIFIGRAEIAAILDKVRTMVLDWAIALERAGIMGEGVSFKSEEKAAAQNNPAITIGSVGTLVGVVGSNNTVRDIVGGQFSVTQALDLARQLRTNHDALVTAGADSQALATAVNGLIIEGEKPEPDSRLVKGFLSDARAALAGAAGNLMASGALTLIGAMLGV